MKKKTKVVAFKRSNIVIENVIQQACHFKILGCDIRYGHDHNVNNKRIRCNLMCGTIHRTLGNKERIDTKKINFLE